jgi:hypothetical protein
LSSEKLRWYSSFEAELVTGSKVLGGALFKVIQSIPVLWTYTVCNKIVEPFQIHDWCVLKSVTTDGLNISSISNVIRTTANMLLAQQYALNARNKCSVIPAPTRLSILPKSQVIKACVLNTPGKTLVYCGNYKNSKLLLSRISWTLNDLKNIPFFHFSAQNSYRAIINKIDKSISAIDRWERILLFPIDGLGVATLVLIHSMIGIKRGKFLALAYFKTRNRVFK